MLLVLLDIGDFLPHVYLPLRVLMQGVAYVILIFFNGDQAVVVAEVLHLLIMVALARERHMSP